MRLALFLPLLGLSATPAFAHHPLAGRQMETLFDGVLSGVGHPILGFDHLAFVVLVGVAASLTRQRWLAPLSYVAVMTVGCLIAVGGVVLPFAEVLVALSLLVMGVVVLRKNRTSDPLIAAAFAGFGLFHGTAFAGALLGQEAGASALVLVGYLAGLGLTQYAIAIAAGALIMRVPKALEDTALAVRFTGAIVAGMGLFLTLEHAETAAFAALGWS